MNHAAVGSAYPADLRFIAPDPAVEPGTLQSGAAIERAHRIVSAQGHGANRRTMLAKIISNESIRFGIEDQVDVSLPIQRDAFGAVHACPGEAKAFEQARQCPVGRCVDGEFDERKARQHGGCRRIEQLDAIDHARTPGVRFSVGSFEAAADLSFEIEQ